MDPLSITTGSLTLAKLAIRLAFSLHSGIESIKNADSTLQIFHGEIQALGNVLQLVGGIFQDSKLKHLSKAAVASNGRLSEVLTSLRGILTDCEDTLSKLDSIIPSTGGEGKERVLRRTAVAWKLDMRSTEMTLIRHQIQTYYSAMQMKISMLQIAIALEQSWPILDRDSLTADMQSLEKDKTVVQAKIEDTRALLPDAFAERKSKNLREHLKVSESVLSYAATVCSTDAGSILDSDVSTIRRSTSHVELESTKYSAIGAWNMNLDSTKYSTIEAWKRKGSSISFGLAISNKRFVAAMQRLKEKQYFDAESLLRTAIRDRNLQEAQLNEARKALIFCIKLRKEYDEAEALIRKLILDADPKEKTAYEMKIELAKCYGEQEKYDEAVEVLSEMLLLRNSSPQQGKQLKRIIDAIRGNQIDNRISVAFKFKHQKNYGQALQILTLLLKETYISATQTALVERSREEIRKEYLESRIRIALEAKERGQYTTAIDDLSRLLGNGEISDLDAGRIHQIIEEVNKERINTRIATAVRLKHEGQYQQALDNLLDLLEPEDISQSQLGHLHQCIAEIYSNMKQTQKALPFALKACEARHDRQIDHLYYESCELVSKLYGRMGDYAEASIYSDEIPKHLHAGRFIATLSTTLKHCGGYRLTDIVFSPGGILFALSRLGVDGLLSVWNTVSDGEMSGRNPYVRRLIQPKSIPTSSVVGLQRALVSVADCKVIVNVMHSVSALVAQEGNRINVSSISASPEGGLLVLGEKLECFCYITLSDKDIEGDNAALFRERQAVAFAPNGRTMAIEDKRRGIQLFTCPSLDLLRTWADHTGPLVFQDNETLVAVVQDRIIVTLDTATGVNKKRMQGHEYKITYIAAAPDGNLLASTSASESIKLWNPTRGTLIGNIEEASPSWGLAFSPKNNRLASGSNVLASAGAWGNIELWHLEIW